MEQWTVFLLSQTPPPNQPLTHLCGITVDPYYPGQPPLDGWPRWAHHPFLKKKKTLRTKDINTALKYIMV